MGNHVSILLVATGARLVASTTGPLIQNLGASAFSSSSEHDQSSCADEAARYGTRLDGYDTCWCASGSDCARDGEWLAVNLGANYNIFEVATKGCGAWDEYIRSYKLQYYYGGQWLWYNNGEVLTGNSDEYVTSYKLQYYYGGQWLWYNNGEVLTGNSDKSTEVRNALNGDNGIVASQLKIWPQSEHESCSTNIEAYGSLTPPPTTRAPTTAPTEKPTTKTPTKVPTDVPTTTKSPTKSPTPVPVSTTSTSTSLPSVSPTDKPTVVPSAAPTDRPTPTPTDAPTEADNEQQVDQNEDDDQDEQGEDEDSLNSNADEDAANFGSDSFVTIGGLSNAELLILATSMVVVCLLCVVGMCVITRLDRVKKLNQDEINDDEIGDDGIEWAS
eukprot:CAMPEP_0202727180 /NCGR_PEP_ID=MMETSP1385-20130828/184993_1 /ASSEMBLY_ACC=CAM_ASM_000861 /TAXON_ID=933848 /ORGANISM="Elphidium margaritaceum" /LENGTH=385 /DNA_ID=CAMNT_0049393419 /DNA_START=906 /DNA_END=2063 /DNA_ORIENTATION=+